MAFAEPLALELTSLALEWPGDFAPVIRAFLASGTLADHWWLWGGDGRITAGHLAVLAERAAAGAVELILFDGGVGADWSWSQRDEAMARRILAASPPGLRTAAQVRRGGTVPVPFGRHLPRGHPARPGRDDQRPVRTREHVTERLHHPPIRIRRAMEVAREGDVVLERQVDHAVRGGRRAPQHVEIVEGAALHLGSGSSL